MGIKKILIVDDEKAMCALVTRFLRSTGYDCESANDSVVGLRMLEKAKFDIVISDIKMPHMDGLKLLGRIRERHPETDVIMITGFADDYSYSDIVKAGAADFIAKPFNLAELKAKIERVSREHFMREQLQGLNTAMGVLLQRSETEKSRLSAQVVSNLEELVFPHLDRLKNSKMNPDQIQHLEMVESSLRDIFSPFLKNLSLHHAHLSAMEVQVANLIKAGKRNKEIASMLGVSLNTVMTHRYHLRSKLGLRQEKVNLRSYLNSTDF
jgi:DNA-binding response OmpR family regulator